MLINIIKKELSWSRPLQPLDIKKIEGISLHHAAHPTAEMEVIHNYHLSKGWAGFAYNFWIDFEGNIFEGRGLNKGAGLYDPLNMIILSIGFKGDYNMPKEIPNAQYNAGIELIKYLKHQIPTIKIVNGHSYWQADTNCPGVYFPLTKMISDVDGIVNEVRLPIKDYNEVADWAKESVKKVIEKGLMIGDDEGYFNPNKPMTRQEVAVVVSRLLGLIN